MFDHIVPEPYAYNLLKHQFNYILGYIEECLKMDVEARSFKIKQDFMVIGTASPDLYLGALSVNEILSETAVLIRNKGLDDEGRFLSFLKANHDFYTYFLSDGSKWVWRYGKEEGRYIHIHPARDQECVLRVKASTLKSALGYYVLYQSDMLDVDVLNSLRVELFGLSPLKTAVRIKELLEGIGEGMSIKPIS